MTETKRIRWTDNGMGGFDGHVGTSKRLTFELWQAPADAGFTAGDWVITSGLPLPDASGPGYTYAFSGKDPGDLRAQAERRLEEFTSSLGAIFPPAAFEFEEDGEPLEVRYAPGAYVRYQHPDAGWEDDRETGRKLLTHGRLYRVAWNDIGQSKTRIGLAGVKGVTFNSVLFEPVADEEVTDAEADEVARRNGIGQTTAATTAREKE